MSDAKVGFVGLGAMGWPMAANLVKKGFDVRVHDVREDVVKRFTSEVGGVAASSPADVAAGIGVLITMLPNSEAVSAALFGDSEIARAMTPGSIVLEMSSGDPEQTRHTAQRLHEIGVAMIDAPVSGAVRRAVTGELSIVLGGRAEDIEKVRPVLLAMGKSLTRAGDIGSGHATKALNNLALAGSFLIALEAMLVGKKFGLDPQALVEFFNASSGMNYNTQTKFKQFILSGTFAAGFSTDLLVKDVGIAVGLAESLDAEIPFSALCHSLWSDAATKLPPASDHTEIAKVAAERVGIRLR